MVHKTEKNRSVTAVTVKTGPARTRNRTVYRT
uniref:Uncharacterized protein n=1 Tax=Arundo donax TaxID=35708 RepID=A0A0A9DUY3_ARUDO